MAPSNKARRLLDDVFLYWRLGGNVAASLRQWIRQEVKDVTDDDVTYLVAAGLGLAALYAVLANPNDATAVEFADTLQADAQALIGGLVAQPPVSEPEPVPAPAPQPQPGPAPVPQPAPAVPGGVGDAFDLHAAAIVGGSPGDVANWPITTELRITQLEPAIKPDFNDPGWPDIIPPGFDGPIQFTLWAFAYLGGQWVGAGFIEFWRGRGDAGNNDAGDVRRQLWQNWWYYAGEMSGYLPAPGDSIGFMVTSGDARMGKGPYSVQQRSNVVVVTV